MCILFLLFRMINAPSILKVSVGVRNLYRLYLKLLSIILIHRMISEVKIIYVKIQIDMKIKNKNHLNYLFKTAVRKKLRKFFFYLYLHCNESSLVEKR